MAVVKQKPTTPGRRGMVRVVTPELHKGRPQSGLVEAKKSISGRNNAGRITVRQRAGLPFGTVAGDTNVTTELLTLREQKTAYRRR